MRRIILCLLSFLICWHCYAQFVFKEFMPSTYTPQTTDYSILQRSLERIEQRRIEAENPLNQLSSLCTETASQILNYSPDRMSSLNQEFDVTKFCYEYFLSIRDNSDISQADKENLAKEIAKYNAILSDANGAISYDAYIDNLKSQLVVEPPKRCRKTSGTTSKKGTSKKSSPRRK